MSWSAAASPIHLRASAVALLLATVPHLPALPLWVLALLPAAIGLRLALGHPPRRWILLALVLLGLAGVLAHFGSINGTQAGGALLCAMLALKFLETRDQRDIAILLCMAYFLAATIFLSDQSIAIAVLVLVSLVTTTTALTYLPAPQGPPLGLRLRHSGTVLAQAIPVMLVLFVLFPRLPSPMWGVNDEASARTGLSDSMSPGQISQLTENSAVAFRASFEGDVPGPGERYWRGPVFWAYDGRTWSRGDPRHSGLPAPRSTGSTLDYEIILEPHGRKWLFALDIPVGAQGEGKVARRDGYELVTERQIDETARYELSSALSYRLEPELPEARRERALELPPDAAPRARELAQRWQRATDSARGVIERALAHFRQEDFRYTFSPQRLNPEKPVDDFLFATREGFCEHFASAFTVLMRAAGVPARVVTGYQGGQMNAVGNYMVVRQSDAHAWSEVWLEGEGWVRVDPTGTVSASRIEQGVSSVPGSAERLALAARPDSGWMGQMARVWDSVDYGWNRFVLGYGPRLQQALLDRLGLADLGRWLSIALMIAALLLTLGAVWLFAHLRPTTRDPIERLWQRALARLRAVGIDTDPSEGPHDLAARVRRERPDLGPAFRPVAAAYVRLRYAPPARGGRIEDLRAAVRAFHPRRRQPDARASASRETSAAKK